MACFIKCGVSKTAYRGNQLVNSPVNINLCTYISKENYFQYPDNTGLPSIRFHGCDVMWVFSDTASRDADFDKILLRAADD